MTIYVPRVGGGTLILHQPSGNQMSSVDQLVVSDSLSMQSVYQPVDLLAATDNVISLVQSGNSRVLYVPRVGGGTLILRLTPGNQMSSVDQLVVSDASTLQNEVQFTEALAITDVTASLVQQRGTPVMTSKLVTRDGRTVLRLA